MLISFKNRHALITGASRGIGRATAIALHKAGATVTAVASNLNSLLRLQQELPGIHVLQIDLSNWTETETKIKEHLAKGHNIDLVVNNAGIAILAPVGEVTEQQCDKTFAVNVKAAINVSQLIAQQMISKNLKGSIVNVSSEASMVGDWNHLVYCASKGALDQATRTMALEYGGKNIRVNAVNPTVVNTDMAIANWSEPVKREKMLAKIPMGRFAEPEEVATVIMFLLSDQLSSMVNGVTLPVDGGYLAC